MTQSQTDSISTEPFPQPQAPAGKRKRRPNLLKAQIMAWMNDGAHSRVSVNDTHAHFVGWGKGLVRDQLAAKEQIRVIFSQNSGAFHPHNDSKDPFLTTYSTRKHMEKSAQAK